MINKDDIYAIVWASNKTEKYWYKVYKDLKAAWYQVVAINPNEQSTILWDPVYSSLTQYKKHIDMVICVVPPKITEKIIQEANSLWIKKIWMQPGAESDKAIEYCKENKMEYIYNACIMIQRPKEKMAVLALSKALKESERNNEMQNKITKKLQDNWFDPIFYPSCFETHYLDCPDISSRIRDFHKAMQDPNIKIIMCVKWGRNSNQLLSHINFELIKAQPKPIIGYSDITIILNAIYHKTGNTSYHGPMLMDLFEDKTKITQTTSLNLWNARTIQTWTAQWTLIWGNLTSFLHLAWTEYFPDLNNKIVFLEDTLNIPANARDRALHQLAMQDWAQNISGILLAKTGKGHNITKELRQKMFSQISAFHKTPILANLNFWHVPNAETLVIWSEFNFNTK